MNFLIYLGYGIAIFATVGYCLYLGLKRNKLVKELSRIVKDSESSPNEFTNR